MRANSRRELPEEAVDVLLGTLPDQERQLLESHLDQFDLPAQGTWTDAASAAWAAARMSGG